MPTNTERRSLATPPTAVNVHHHESESIYNTKNRQDFHHHCERVAKACMLGRCCFKFSLIIIKCIHMEKEEGNGLVQMATRV
jgi:hypothetical protein